MSGVLGIWHLDGRPVERAELARSSAMLQHRGSQESSWVDGPVGLACRQPEASEIQPAVGPSGAVLVFDGRLDNREELLAEIDGPASVTDTTVVLAAHAHFGDRFVERLNGDFALALFDPSKKQLLLARDAIGVRPLYYARMGSTLLFASEIKALLAHPLCPSAPNDRFLAQQLLGRLHLVPDNGETCFEEILSVPPAHVATLTAERWGLRRYWDFDISRGVKVQSFEDHAAQFATLFRQAIRRRLRSAHPVAVSVSGGLDSSSIFCFAHDLSQADPALAPVLGLSYRAPAGSPADEEAFLLEIERSRAARIQRVIDLPSPMVEHWRDEVRQTESPMLDSQPASTRAILRGARSRGARVLLTGHWGDQFLFDDTYLMGLAARLRWGTVSAHLDEYARWLTDASRGEFRRRFAADAVKHFLPRPVLSLLRAIRSVARPAEGRAWYSERFRQGNGDARGSWENSPARTHAESLYRDARSKYHTCCMEWNNKVAASEGVEIAFPFLDRDLLVFLMATPGEVQTRNGVPKAILREAAHGIVPDSIVQRRWKADFSTLVNQRMMDDYPEVTRILEAESLSSRLGYVAPERLTDELTRARDSLRGDTCEASWRLKNLLGLELWLQVFFNQKLSTRSEVSYAQGKA